MANSHLSIFLPSLLLIFFLLLASLSPSSAKQRNYLDPRSSLSIDTASDILSSPSGTFSCGFYNISPTASTFSIWFSRSINRTVVWTANPDRPVYNRQSKMTFKKDGNLILTDYDGEIIWSSNTSSRNPQKLELFDSGNLVISDKSGKILWSSFDFPTDTLLPNQPINNTGKLLSANRMISLGYYMLYFDDYDILSLKYIEPEVSSIYWPNVDFTFGMNGRIPYNTRRYGVLYENGRFNATDGLDFNASDFGTPGIWRKLTLDIDGNLRLYSLNETNGSWSVSWIAISQSCNIHGKCGRNGMCIYSPKPACTCPTGFEMVNPSNWSQGCEPQFNISCDENYGEVDFLYLPNSDYRGGDYQKVINGIPLRECKQICERECSCIAIEYKPSKGDCYTKSTLVNGQFYQGFWGEMYIKIPKNFQTFGKSFSRGQSLFCKAPKSEIQLNFTHMSNTSDKWVYLYWFASSLFVIEIFFIVVGFFFIVRKEGKPLELEVGYKVISSQFRRYTYKELEVITSRFKDVLGSGGSGVVYKGILDDERLVAVKKLEDVTQGEEEFQAELSLIRHIYHMNLVRMWGFCSEQFHRILVLEYVEYGSLDKFLFNEASDGMLLGWKHRYKIALGVAKGLAYLHHECLEWIIHCDVKPENVLIDLDFEPKIADFGLAKLLHRDGGNPKLSRIRGTRGYIAPEWASSLPITAKVDVYSYGVVLLELVMGVRVSDWVINKEEEEVEMVLRRLVKRLKVKLESNEPFNWVLDFVDSRLNGDFNCSQATLMVGLALSCLEEERSKRPDMKHVAEILLMSGHET